MKRVVWVKRVVWASCLFIGIHSCSEEKELDTRINNVLEKTQTIAARQQALTLFTTPWNSRTPGRTQPFGEGSEMGLYITSGKTGEVYKGIEAYKRQKAVAMSENGRLRWTLQEPVYLDSEPVLVYAYSPYPAERPDQASETFRSSVDPAHLPLRISPDASQTPSYRYGTHSVGQKEVNGRSPVALLTMKHALSFISFRIAQASETQGSFLLEAVEIGNQGEACALWGEGMLDITTGQIARTTPLARPTRLTLPEPLLLTSAYSEELLLKVIPTEGPIQAETVEACFFINQKPYFFSLPASARWKKGYTYAYQLLFQDHTLRLTQTTIGK